MSPPNPKRPPRAPRPPGDTVSRPEPEVELPFDDDEVVPLQADDPRPQRVPQFPAGPRRAPRRGPGGAPRPPRDRELPARFTSGEYEDPGHSPAFLYVERGPGAGQLVPIKQGVLVLGRASTSDLRLQHPSISRRHAQLTRHGDRLTLKDLGSQNGTYVNRTRLASELELHSGDELSLGNALLRVRGPGALPESPRTASSRPMSSLRGSLNARRLLLLAAATGSLVAVFLTLGAVRLARSEPAGPSETLEAAQAEVPLGPVPEELAAPPEPAARAEVPRPVEEPPAAPLPVPAPAPATPAGKVRGAPGARAPSASAIAGNAKPEAPKAPASRQRKPAVSKPSAPSATAAPATSTSAGAAVPDAEAEAEALSLYESGNAESALAMARRAHLDELATTLTRFQAEWSAGNSALTAGDSASAIQHLSTALELDQRIAKGWGSFAPRIRKALAQAHSQAGSSQDSQR
jgi:outer membrane biosynthesis protein TonB